MGIAVGLRMTLVNDKNALMWARLHLLMRECQAFGVKVG